MFFVLDPCFIIIPCHYLVQMLQLPGRVRRVELHQVPHSDSSLRGVPQVPELPHGLQVFAQRPEPHQHPAPNSHWGTGQVRVLQQHMFHPHVERRLCIDPFNRLPSFFLLLLQNDLQMRDV